MEHYSLFRKDKCTAGEREGGGKPPARNWIIAIKND